MMSLHKTDKMAEMLIWHQYCMKVYRFGDSVLSNIMIIEDDGTITISMIGVNNIHEEEAEIVKCNGGYERIKFGNGSSMPYTDEKGVLNEKWVLIFEK